jgi:hypothetical protein
VVAAACVPAPPPTVYDAACNGTLVGSTPGTVASPQVTELSGLAASRRGPGVWWGHNDSKLGPKVFAIGDDGRDLGAFTLSIVGLSDRSDWEDIAVGPGPVSGVHYLYVGDIGDDAEQDGGIRPWIDVYRVAEPAVDPSVVDPPDQTLTGVAKLSLEYPDKARDADALIVDPVSGELYVITKSYDGVALVFRAPGNLAAGSTTVMTWVATLSLGPFKPVTGADVTAAGDFVAVRTYDSVLLYPRPAGAPLADAFAQPSCSGAVPGLGQFESVAFTPDGRGYVTAAEGSHPTLHRYDAP